MKTRLCGSGLGHIQNITGWCTGKKDDKETIQLFKNREIMSSYETTWILCRKDERPDVGNKNPPYIKSL